ncbi:hypothetical protein AB7849_19235 [Rhodanobacter sp. 115]|uniref:hypothetical protein n=2 Tax=Rhodanobacter sp. FW021-MT20 TaxID=1162282 RepID=UPI0034E3A004
MTPEDEYKKLIQVHTGIQPLGAHPFGESINLYNGALSFEVTDVSLPGSGPTLQLSRSLDTTELDSFTLNRSRPFGDWDLDIPRIETATAKEPSVTGWEVEATNPLDRCTDFGAPPPVPTPLGATWDPGQWWYGYHLIIPGRGSQELLERSTSIIPTSGGVFPAVTKRNWMIRCGVTADDGGEGFVAMAPDGTQYTFAHLVYRPMSGISQGGSVLVRRDALMYVTQVRDRFGNTLTYHYDSSTGYLSSITASDGRSITVSYVSGSLHISSITAQASNGTTRIWTYSYDSSSSALTRVQLPDGSAWSYNLGPLQKSQVTSSGGNCYANVVPTLTGNTVTGTATTPSGLTGSFTLIPMMRGRSYVLKSCYGGNGGTQAVYSTYPEVYYQPSMSSEVVSGANVPIETWSYSYSPANESWKTDSCASTSSCASTVYIDVTNPGGSTTRYTHSNRFDATEGQLLRTDTYSGAAGSTLMRSVVNTYANPTGGPWPSSYGADPQDRNNLIQTEELAPLGQRQIQQNGDTYTWHANAFNDYAQVTDATRSNSISGEPSIEEATTYLNDTNTWVLGLPETVTNVGTGEQEVSNIYNTSSNISGIDLLTSRARFGETLMTYTWNGAGQLASFTDGDNHTTTLGNYYRGIPQAIGYPDGTSESLSVDDFGDITSITDQAGHTTQYSYDALGRVTQITYPYDSSIDSASWYPKTFSYSYVTGAERGVAAGHWRETVTQGASTDTTYYDAELRPVLNDTSNGNTDITTAKAYDWRGLTTFASYPVSGSPALSSVTSGTHSTYDALGRLTQSQQDSELGTLTTAMAYLSGAREQVTDPKGNVTTTTYQVFDQPSYGGVLEVQAPDGVTQTVTRDVYGNPTSITQSGSYGTETDSVTKTLVYDSFHRLCRTTEPETGSTVLAYDGANNIAWSANGLSLTGTGCDQDQVAAAAETTRTYDVMNRVLTIQSPSGTQSTVYTYDALGRVHTAASGIATQAYAYNSLGLVTGESLAVASSGYTWALGYSYDAYGHLASMNYPAGTGTSETVSYAPDAWGRPTQVGSYATGVSYFPDGQLQGFTFASGTSYLADENTRHLTRNFTYGVGSTLAVSEDLAYDADGNLTSVNDLVDGTRSKTFGYDALNRLTNASAPNLYGTESYTYDPVNNLRTRLSGGATYTYNYDASNKLTSITQGASTVDSFGYDVRGNEITRNGATLTFDAKNQLTSVPGVATYAYDAEGRRVEKQLTSASYPTYAFYGHAGQLMYQYDPATATATNFVYLGTKLIGDSTTVQLTQPGGISFSANPSGGSTGVSWGSVPDATSYMLQQSSDGGGSWSTVYSGSASSTTLSGLAGGRYVYRVQACASSGCGLWTTSPTLGVQPAIPTISTPGGTVNGTYTVSWSSPASATGYIVQEQVNGRSWTTLASNTPATSISRPGTSTGSYVYQVEALNSYGTRGWGTSATVSVNTAYGVVPIPVPTLSVPGTSSTGSATVSWTAASPVTGYILQQSGNGGTSWSTVYSGTGTSMALSNLGNGNYTYQVQACNDTAGDSVCTAWARGGTLVVTHPPTSAPGLSVPGTNSTGSYTVNWSPVSTATSYTLQQSVNGGGWTTVYSGAGTGFGLSGEGNGTYAYRVQACNAGGCSGWSGTGTSTVTHPPASAPGLSVPGSSSTGSYTVSWGGDSTATSYTLQQSSNGGSSWGTAYSGGGTSDAISGIGDGTYTYRVQACNAGGCGPWSGTGTIKVAIIPAEPGYVSVPTDVYYPNGRWAVNWPAVSAATSYTLQRAPSGTGTPLITVYTGSATSADDGGTVMPGTYVYSVKACNANGCSGWRASSLVTVICSYGTSAMLKPGTVQPYLIRCP